MNCGFEQPKADDGLARRESAGRARGKSLPRASGLLVVLCPFVDRFFTKTLPKVDRFFTDCLASFEGRF